MELNNIYLGDCLELMIEIPDKSIDMVLCDLPYGTTKCKWDVIIPLDKLWEQYKRIIKDNGVILLFAQTPFDKVLGYSNLEWLKYEWIWEKTQATGFLNAKKMPMKAHENILVFYKNPPTYNPQKTTGHNPMNSYTKKPEVQNKTTLYGEMNRVIKGGGDTDRYPRSVQVFSSDKQKTKSSGFIHPTQKPVGLLEYLIKTYTNESDVVLDNAAGSSSTAIACLNTNRNWIMMENDKSYYELSLKRIESQKKLLSL
jgi:site-specific DNA-methyltransferase (adenine-specific)